MKTINVRQVFTGVWSKELRKYKDRVTDQKDQGSSFMPQEDRNGEDLKPRET